MEQSPREYQRVIGYLCDLAASGTLSVGSRLPTERQLAATLSIGRNSAREALRTLENMGVIESRQGSGNYLVGNTSKAIADMMDILLLLRRTDQAEVCSFRQQMEKAICLSILETGTMAAHRDALLAALAGEESAASPQEAIEADKRFHYALIEATENRLWITMAEAISVVYRRWINQVLTVAKPAVKEELHRAHRGILHALEADSREDCEAWIGRHYALINDELKMTL